MDTPIAALDVGGTHVSSALVDARTWQLVSEPGRWDLDSTGTVSEIMAVLSRAAAGVGEPRQPVWGVAMPGPFDYERGVGKFRGVAKFESLYDFDLRAALVETIVPAPEDVAFIGDAAAFTLGEWLNGAASGATRCVGITLGTGVGSGFVAGGRVVDSGPEVPPGGNAYRLRIGNRPLEDVISRRAIRSAYAAATGDKLADLREICDRARRGEAAAGEILGDAFVALGAAIAPWVSRFGAEVLVIGGSVAASWDVLEVYFDEGFRRVAAPPRVVVASDPARAPLLGAARRALDMLASSLRPSPDLPRAGSREGTGIRRSPGGSRP
jgi:glucokinase